MLRFIVRDIPFISSSRAAYSMEVLTSSDSSINITAIPATNTIDFTTVIAPTSKYSRTFNNTSDWTLNGSNYELTVLAATHGKSAPVVETLETIAGTSEVVYPTIIKNAGNDVIYLQIQFLL